MLAAVAFTAVAAVPASANPSSDPLHGGQGEGLTVVGHSDLGGGGLNGHVAVLGDYAYVGVGTNGGFAAQWNKRPKCDALTNTVKVVSLVEPAKPTVTSTIGLPGTSFARAVSAIKVRPAPGSTFAGSLLAIALEKCAGVANAVAGVQYYDVSDPARPLLLSFDPSTAVATRDVSLFQSPEANGRVFALQANQGGGIRMVDISNPRLPIATGTVAMDTFFSSSTQGCWPFGYAQAVTTNQDGSRAYAGYGDQGLLRLDLSGGIPKLLTQTRYGASEEGNSFRFVPNAAETTALATDEDLLPARTTLTITSGSASTVSESPGSAPGVFGACEAIWGGPLYRSAVPSLPDRQIVPVPGTGCDPANYSTINVTDKIALINRGCDFVDMAQTAQAAGADGVLVTGGTFFSTNPSAAGDAGVTIPFAVITAAAGDAIKAAAANGTVTGTLEDKPDTWGALRILDISGATPAQTAVFNAPHTNVLTPGDGLYHAVNTVWAGDQALVAWMSDGLRMVDVSDRNAPKPGPFFIPEPVADPTGHYGTVPLVVGVERFGARMVITDINGGLYVLEPTAGLGPGGNPPAGAITPGGGTATPGGTAPSPSATAPGAGSGVQPVLSTAKLALARATIDRRARVLDVLAPITRLASGRVRVELQAAGRRHSFTAPVDSQRGRIRFRQRIPKAQADLSTGILTIRYPGDADTRPQEVRLRAASQKAGLELARPRIDNGRIQAQGTVTQRARGIVRLQVQYVVDGRTRTVTTAGRIQAGRWKIDQRLSREVRGEIARRSGSVHSYTLFTGYYPRRIRGEMRSYQLLGAR